MFKNLTEAQFGRTEAPLPWFELTIGLMLTLGAGKRNKKEHFTNALPEEVEGKEQVH